VEGRLPDVPKLVVAVAPHTSNWDFALGVAAMFALGVRVHWLGKHTLFRPPLGALMRWLGGTPVDRTTPQQAVAQVVAAFAAHDRFVLGLSPEGTRRRIPAWRTGFYHIARGAGVPVLPVALDYARRRVTICAAVPLTGDEAADLARIRAPFHAGMARHPAQY
jgi:1-acyl-sn-glycerol-3-phosphate acyltransferase